MKTITQFLMITALTFFGASVAHSEGIQPEGVITNSSQYQTTKEYVANLIENEEKWVYILSKIESGEKRWLDVAELLRSGTDASSTNALNYSVSFALKNSTDNVLTILGDQYSIEDVCGSPFIEENSYYVLGFLQAIREKVANSKYYGIKKEKCLKNIESQIKLLNDTMVVKN